jgi:lysophospholipase L1-like esterase
MSTAKKLTIQVAIFLALCGLIEGIARLLEKTAARSAIELKLTLQPYRMFSGGPGRTTAWENYFTKKQIPSSMVFNNYGYAESFDYQLIPDADYLARHGRKPGEKIVLIAGGSTVHGVGATRNENTIAGRLQHHLNEKSAGARYRVLNMGMGSWIADQQFIGLLQFGLPFDPDWIVVMDGHNDGVVPCVHGSGAGNPMEWPTLLYVTYGGTGGRSSPAIETLARHSAAVRWISGMRPDESPKDPRPLVIDNTDPDALKRFRVKMAGITVAEQDRQVEFYLQAQRNVLALFHRPHVMFSTQPVFWDNTVSPLYRAAFAPGGTAFDALKAELDRFMSKNRNVGCEAYANIQPIAGPVHGYFFARSALRMIDFAADAQAKDPARKIFYRNIEGALPYSDDLRRPFFVDNAHLSDLGQDRVAEFFADSILAAERGTTFDFAAFAKRSADIAAAAR